MASSSYSTQLSALRSYFETGATRSYEFRKTQLKKLKQAILDREEDFYTALYTDLKKSKEEVWITELGLVLEELRTMLSHLREWMEPERVSTNLLNLPSRSRLYKEPLGVVLIISPWNYPFQLLINPLVGAIAAGNCVVMKPSMFAPATDKLIKEMIEKTFPPEYILLLDGDGSEVVPNIMNNFRFDHVFFTGSTTVGKIIYKLAAEQLVPVTLELGGKSPCVVEADANIKVSARRISMTKFSNAGQMCVAPDYILVHESRKEELIAELKKCILQFFGEKPEESYTYGKIINERQFDRIVEYIKQGTLQTGGRSDRSKLFIEPTIVTDVAWDSKIMKEEIFGPVLPVLGFASREEARRIISNNPNPLAFYVFTSNRRTEEEWLQAVPSGGGCVNNASWHLTNHHLPFGGRGYSGIGNYHGKYSFAVFSHKKAILKTPTWFDPAIKYPPFKGKLGLFKKVVN